MQNTTIRLRPDQAAFIDQVTKERATDLSQFVRMCVDHSAASVADTLPKRTRLISLTALRKERHQAAKLRVQRKRRAE